MASTRVVAALALCAIGGRLAHAANCTETEGSSIFSAYSAFQDSVSADCGVDQCAQACIDTQRLLSTALPDCEYVDGTNYRQQVSASLSSCGVATDDAGYVPSTLPCLATQSNVTIILYSQYESEMREACDADKCSTDCISIVNQLTAVLPDCLYSDGINYHNESIGIIDACGNATAAGSSSAFGPDSAASGAVSLFPALAGVLAVLAACL